VNFERYPRPAAHSSPDDPAMHGPRPRAGQVTSRSRPVGPGRASRLPRADVGRRTRQHSAHASGPPSSVDGAGHEALATRVVRRFLDVGLAI
jgi:hypothetical protein